MKRYLLAVIAFALLYSLATDAQEVKNENNPGRTFTNPLFPAGADPYVVRHNDRYYYVSSAGTSITIRSGSNLDSLGKSKPVTVWKAPAGTMWSREVWAPEMHFLNGSWFIYFAADDGQNRNHRMYAIENRNSDPLKGEWIFRGKIREESDKWAIDGTVFVFGKRMFFVWSGWEDDVNGRQDLYIAEMSDPVTLKSKRVLLSRPEYDWERVGDLNNPDDVPHVDVNEGPAALVNGRDLFIVYSASGCWTDSYCLGLLKLKKGGDPLDAGAWTKFPNPVFKGDETLKVFATGHNSFFKSPDGKENWFIYHANSARGQGCGRYRSPRAQKFTWSKDGTPDFGLPVHEGIKMPVPSQKNDKRK